MRLIAFVGDSDTGKTGLIKNLIKELSQRGYSVAVIKHCAHGFKLSPEGKDSSQFMEAGADSTAMLSPERVAVLFRNDAKVSYKEIAWEFFPGADFVLVEGGRDDPKTRKIEVLRKGISEKVTCPLNELAAVVSDEKIVINKPVFNPEETSKIADFLEKEYENEQ